MLCLRMVCLGMLCLRMGHVRRILLSGVIVHGALNATPGTYLAIIIIAYHMRRARWIVRCACVDAMTMPVSGISNVIKDNHIRGVFWILAYEALDFFSMSLVAYFQLLLYAGRAYFLLLRPDYGFLVCLFTKGTGYFYFSTFCLESEC